MKLAVIEGMETDTELLNRYAKAWSKERNIPLVITMFPDEESFLSMWKENREFDVVFLDIRTKETDGMETAARIREYYSDVIIIFTTDVDEKKSGEKGANTETVHYLSRPVDMEKMYHCMDMVLRKDKKEKFLQVKTKVGTLKIAVDKIMYVEAQEGGCVIEFCPQKDRTFQVETTDNISELEEQLDKSDFIRCHRSYIVRIDKIRRVKREWIELRNGSRIAVSRNLCSVIGQMCLRYFRIERERSRQQTGSHSENIF